MRLHTLALILFSSWPCLAREAERAHLSLPELQAELGRHVRQEKFAQAEWGIQILSLKSGAVLFETNAHKLLKPASNAKLFSGALALDFLGPEHRIRTSLYAQSEPRADGVLADDLIVYGRGDPSFAARFQNGSYRNLLGRLVGALRAAGVKRVEGDLIADETCFTGPRFGANWSWDDLQYYYGAEVSALTVQENVIDLSLKPSAVLGAPCELTMLPQTGVLRFINRTRTVETNGAAEITIYRPLGKSEAWIFGTLPQKHEGWEDAATVPNPARWFGLLLREALAREGITISGEVKVRSWPEFSSTSVAELKELAHSESPPLRDLLPKMLKPSQNLYAQLLLLQVGLNGSAGAGTTEDAGLRELRAFVARAGIEPGRVLLDEGSGLSRSALVTPGAITRLLQFMAGHPQAAIFREALPEPGEGTLRRRLPELKGKLRAKTGTLRYVNSLSGYIRTAGDEELAFAIMLNAYQNTSDISSREELDFIPRLLARLE